MPNQISSNLKNVLDRDIMESISDWWGFYINHKSTNEVVSFTLEIKNFQD